MIMEELLENLLYSALFPQMDKWRSPRSENMRPPSDEVMRVFVRMELRLQQRYGSVEFQKMVESVRFRALFKKNPMLFFGVGLAALVLGTGAGKTLNNSLN